MSDFEIDDLTVINLEILKTIEEINSNSNCLTNVQENIEMAYLLNDIEEIKLQLLEAKIMLLQKDMQIMSLKKELLNKEKIEII